MEGVAVKIYQTMLREKLRQQRKILTGILIADVRRKEGIPFLPRSLVLLWIKVCHCSSFAADFGADFGAASLRRPIPRCETNNFRRCSSDGWNTHEDAAPYPSASAKNRARHANIAQHESLDRPSLRIRLR